MIYVMSDIHGNLRRFNSIMEQIRLQPEDTLYILGDIIDRHPHGIRILRQIKAMSNAKMLLGNHEYMMLKALDEPYDGLQAQSKQDLEKFIQHWYRNGGEVTHRHWKRIRKSDRPEILAYLKALPLSFDITVSGTTYKLVHAAPPELYKPPMEPYKDRTHFSVWKRLQSDDPLPGDYTLIFGHTPTDHFQSDCPMKLFHGERRIGIDCGSGYPIGNAYGRLACLRLDDMRVFYSE